MAKPDLQGMLAIVEILGNRPVLTRKDIAARYRVTLTTVDNWHNAGTLPPARYLNRGRAGRWGPLWRPCDIERAEVAEKLLRRHKEKGQR